MTAFMTKAPWHLWAVGIVATLWNAGGAFDYLMTQTKADWYMSELTPDQLEYFYNFPAWAVAAWAFGVWGAFIGSLLLLLRSRFAIWSFAISIAGLAGSALFQFTSDVPDSLTSIGYNIFMLAIWANLIFLLWYAIRMRTSGVLR